MTDQQMSSPTSEGPYGAESERALEAFASIPGDSEHEADYGQKSEGHDPLVREVLELPPAELTAYFELAVDITVTLPDGTTFNYRESVEKDQPDDYDLDEAAAIVDVASETMLRRLSRTPGVD